MSERIPIGIVGVGMVGGPVRRWFIEKKGYVPGTDLFCRDADPAKGHDDDVNRAAVVFVCVPTPPAGDGSCDTSIVERVVADIADGHIVVIKSTVPPGTTQRLQDARPGLALMFNPEFLTESQAWEDFCSPSRQLIGTTAQSAAHAIQVLLLLPHDCFRRPDTPIYGPRQVVTATEAELVKYAGNVFGAMKVAFANVLADQCHALSAVTGTPVDYGHVRAMLGADLRIGPAWLDVDRGDYSGFGGYCFPKDTEANLAAMRGTQRRYVDAGMPSGGVERASTLRDGIAMLAGVNRYNEQLLAEQGLTVADVSKHDTQLVLGKRRKIRLPPA